MMKSGVYRIDLGGDGWFYVGSSQDLNKRERDHRSDLRCGSHGNKIVQRVFDKYGVFEFRIVGRYHVDEILDREQVLIDKYRHDPKCANIGLAAANPMTGRKHSDETRARMSATMRLVKNGSKGTPCSPETRAKISAALVGRVISTEHRAALSAAMTGKKKSPQHRAALRAAWSGRKRGPQTPEHRAAIGAASRGRRHTDAARAKMSASRTAWWALQRATKANQ